MTFRARPVSPDRASRPRARRRERHKTTSTFRARGRDARVVDDASRANAVATPLRSGFAPSGRPRITARALAPARRSITLARARRTTLQFFYIARTSVAAARTVGAARVTPRDRASAAPRALGARNRALAPPPSVARADMDATGVTVIVVRRWCCCVGVVTRAHVVVVVASIIVVVVVCRRAVEVAPSRGGANRVVTTWFVRTRSTIRPCSVYYGL